MMMMIMMNKGVSRGHVARNRSVHGQIKRVQVTRCPIDFSFKSQGFVYNRMSMIDKGH